MITWICYKFCRYWTWKGH